MSQEQSGPTIVAVPCRRVDKVLQDDYPFIPTASSSTAPGWGPAAALPREERRPAPCSQSGALQAEPRAWAQ